MDRRIFSDFPYLMHNTPPSFPAATADRCSGNSPEVRDRTVSAPPPDETARRRSDTCGEKSPSQPDLLSLHPPGTPAAASPHRSPANDILSPGNPAAVPEKAPPLSVSEGSICRASGVSPFSQSHLPRSRSSDDRDRRQGSGSHLQTFGSPLLKCPHPSVFSVPGR